MTNYDGAARWHEWRTSRRERRCHGDGASRDCTRLIRPGERYCKSSLAPDSDIGNVGWWNSALCAPCANHYRYVDPKAGEAVRAA